MRGTRATAAVMLPTSRSSESADDSDECVAVICARVKSNARLTEFRMKLDCHLAFPFIRPPWPMHALGAVVGRAALGGGLMRK